MHFFRKTKTNFRIFSRLQIASFANAPSVLASHHNMKKSGFTTETASVKRLAVPVRTKKETKSERPATRAKSAISGTTTSTTVY